MKGVAMLGRALCMAIVAATMTVAQAQTYPNRMVTIIVPYPPGGSAGVQARILAQKLGEDWNQSVIVDYRPGAGTTLGASLVAAAAPDGYTLYLAGTSHTISASLYKDLHYDAVKSFAPVSMLAVSPFIVAAKPSLGIKTLKELIDLAKAKPGVLTYGSSGNGAGPHLSGELLKSMAGINLLHVPYKGSAPALQDLMGGQIDLLMADVSAVPQIKAGKVVAIAVTTARRSSALPDVPTVAESGLPGYETTNWSAILAPAGTPRDVVMKINAGIRKALSDNAVKEVYKQQGFDAAPSTPEELEKHMTAEVQKYAKTIRDANIRID